MPTVRSMSGHKRKVVCERTSIIGKPQPTPQRPAFPHPSAFRSLNRSRQARWNQRYLRKRLHRSYRSRSLPGRRPRQEHLGIPPPRKGRDRHRRRRLPKKRLQTNQFQSQRAHIQWLTITRWSHARRRAELEACDRWAVQGKRVRVLQVATLPKRES
jgi:hypothetical protein